MTRQEVHRAQRARVAASVLVETHPEVYRPVRTAAGWRNQRPRTPLRGAKARRA